jgi:Tol biopolymer transport system component
MFIYNFNNSQRTDLSVQKEDGTNDLDPRFSPNEASVIFVNTSNDGISQRNIFKQLISNNTRTELFTDSSMPDWE